MIVKGIFYTLCFFLVFLTALKEENSDKKSLLFLERKYYKEICNMKTISFMHHLIIKRYDEKRVIEIFHIAKKTH